MRNIVNISLPARLSEAVDGEIATGSYASKSEFFRTLLRGYLEEKLAKELAESRAELQSGKGKLLRSLSDLR